MLTRKFINNFANKLLQMPDKDIDFYNQNNYALGFFPKEVIFRKHNLITSSDYLDIPELGKTVLIEDNVGHFYTVYLDYKEWKDISENKFDWFQATNGCYFTDLDDETIIAWYEIPWKVD